jgi:hypothetical protein
VVSRLLSEKASVIANQLSSINPISSLTGRRSSPLPLNRSRRSDASYHSLGKAMSAISTDPFEDSETIRTVILSFVYCNIFSPCRSAERGTGPRSWQYNPFSLRKVSNAARDSGQSEGIDRYSGPDYIFQAIRRDGAEPVEPLSGYWRNIAISLIHLSEFACLNECQGLVEGFQYFPAL